MVGLQLLWSYHGSPSNRAVCLQRLCLPCEQGKFKVGRERGRISSSSRELGWLDHNYAPAT